MAGSIFPISMVARDRMMRGCWWNLAPYCCDTTIRTLFRIAITPAPLAKQEGGRVLVYETLLSRSRVRVAVSECGFRVPSVPLLPPPLYPTKALSAILPWGCYVDSMQLRAAGFG